MKKAYLISFLLFITASNVFSQSGWFFQNPYPSLVDYKDIKYANEFVGCAVGSNGTIIRTTDKGNTWSIVQQTFLNTDIWYSIFFVNSSTGYICGDELGSGKILKTTNSGVNWTSLSFPANSFILSSIFFPNTNIGFVIGDYGSIFKTTDAGANWTRMSEVTGTYYTDVNFVNEYTGFIIGTGSVFRKTTNGGVNWFNVNLNLNNHDLNCVYFVNSNTGYAKYTWWLSPYSSGTTLFKTTNEGANWTSQTINATLNSKMLFLNVSTGYTPYGRSFLKTTNAGLNWLNLNDIPLNRNLTAVATNGSDILTAVGEKGTICRSNDLNDSWFNISSFCPNFSFQIAFVNSTTGFIASYCDIYKTTNSGMNWFGMNSQNSGFERLHLVDTACGYTSTSSSRIYKTTNGGVNWLVSNFNSNYGVNGIYAINRDTVFVSGNGARIHRSLNGGEYWTESILGNWDQNMGEICFINSKTGYLLGGNFGYDYFKTTNTGGSWQRVPIGLDVVPYKIKKIDSLSLYCSSRLGLTNTSGLIISTNSGLNWTYKMVSGPYYGGDSYFINRNTGYYLTTGNYSTSNCYLWKTTNAGDNWTNVTLPINVIKDLQYVVFLNEQTGFISGNGVLLKTTNGGSVFGIEPTSGQIPHSFSLHQNYPNPFNPVTKIQFQIPLLRGVSEGRGVSTQLIIYDISGRVVTTLVNEQLQPGSYSVDWDGTGYASGVYFYSLITNEFTETKRMVLVK